MNQIEAKLVRALLLQLRQMAVNGWSEGIDPRGQCERIVNRIDEFAFAHKDKLRPDASEGEQK
ncbi:hypothetical protein BLAT2472_10726 [Burkholderia latens]|uniref:hypothetical protein n=1 Tax=Burkholderia latens TaxID=488446 RepID=UPI0039A6237C